MTHSIRLLDLGRGSALRSQTIYHAVAHAFGPTTPDTIILVSPATPYVCIGCHQELALEVDQDYCREHGLPIYRREVGGGAVYLDHNQLFVQWVFRREHLPAALDARFALYIQPLVATYRQLGIEAYHRPINDIQVGGRKIGGTGAMATEFAEVMVGSLMFDFDSATMARVLKVPSEKMRDKVFQSLQDYMTTMTRELGQAPPREQVVASYLEQGAAALGVSIVPGTLSADEERIASTLDSRFVSAAWLEQKGNLRQPGVKIHEDVRVVEGAFKAPGGLIRAIVRLRAGLLDDVNFSGDFTLLPASALGSLEAAIRGVPLEHPALEERLAACYATHAIVAPGVQPGDFATAVVGAGA